MRPLPLSKWERGFLRLIPFDTFNMKIWWSGILKEKAGKMNPALIDMLREKRDVNPAFRSNMKFIRHHTRHHWHRDDHL